MLIKKIKLENIRSYVNGEINFPEGSSLLAGDIGSGKSSILLALDFAFFGLRKGNLSGASLLRNGADDGSVNLEFEIDNKNIIINRRLKRIQDSIIQDSGYIVMDGERRDASAIELKQAILDLLNYPKELLTKSKSLIYRYTVYTPQEEMKFILLGEKDIRLDTLRRVFDIDKYKRIKENSKIFITFLKQKRKELEGKIYDLEDKKKLVQEKVKEFSVIDKNLQDLIPRITEINKLVDNKRKEIKLIEDDIKKLNELKKESELVEFKLENSQKLYNKNLDELEELEIKINKLENEIKDLKLQDIDELKKQINEFNSELSLKKDELEMANRKINELETKKFSSLEIKNKITKLDKCPLCQQDVKHEHKNDISSKEETKIIEYERGINENTQKKIILQDKIRQIEIDLEISKDKRASSELNKLKLNDLQDKKTKKELMEKEKSRLILESSDLKEKFELLNEQINQYKDLNYEEKRKELDKSLEKEKTLEIERASYLANIQELNKTVENLNKEITLKLLTKNNITRINDIQFWLEEYFINVIDLIEKQVMLRVHGDFNSLFEKWFNMLMENENFLVRLDEEFTPIIHQNGHDIDYLYLSGGEKTATALAYRLALNQVINNLISSIKTRDLLILDEPTDGFSDEQLDRVRNVLSELNLKQLILVSHEPKIESFVDNIIR
ncbi:MAG: AAA family ATPase, partial [Nanoarchaeota archaeon]